MILTKKSRRFFYTFFQEVVILKIYLDVLFLENFLMDYILLMLTGKILQKQKRRMGILAASLIGSGYTMLYVLLLLRTELKSDSLFLLLLQIGNVATAYLMVICAYAKESGKQRGLCLLTLEVCAYLTGGILTWAENTFADFARYRGSLYMATGAVFFSYMFLKEWMKKMRERLFQKKCHLPVRITFGEKQIRCQGLMDSGNSLYEPITGRPVVIVERQLLISNEVPLPDGFFAIPYHAIGTQKGILKGVLADELEIPEQQGEQRWQKVMLGIYEGKVSQKDEYQVILHPNL